MTDNLVSFEQSDRYADPSMISIAAHKNGWQKTPSEFSAQSAQF
jgi:hypothetical protein